MSRDWNLDAPAPRPGLGGTNWTSTPTLEVAGRQPGWPTRVGYLLASLLVLGVTFANFNPSFGFFQQQSRGFDARRWPWELFQGPDGPVLRWFPPHAFLIAMMLSGMALLLCAFLRPSRSRAGLALAAFVLLAGMLMPSSGDFLIVAGGNVAFALLVAGVFSAGDRPRSPAATRLLCMAALAVAAFVMLPLSSTSGAGQDLTTKMPYVSAATQTVESLAQLLGDHPPQIIEDDGSAHTANFVDWARGNLITLPMLLGLIVAGLVLLGLGGSWASIAMGLLVLTAAFGAPLDHAARELHAAQVAATHTPEGVLSSADTLAAWARNFTEAQQTVLRLTLLPLALGLAEYVRVRRQTA